MDPRMRRRLGKSAVEVTAMGLGAAPLGGFRGAIHPAEARGVVRTAYDAGLRYIDTSPYYGYGRSELVCGETFRDLPRDSFTLSTKVGRVLSPLRAGDSTVGLRPGGLPFRPAFDYSREGTLRSLEHSQARLGLARIDIVFVHDVDLYTHRTSEAYEQACRQALEGAVPALVGLREAGLIGAVGVGLNEIEPCLRFAQQADIDCILLAGRYTLLEQRALEELLPLCERKGIAVVVGGPFNSGVLVSGPAPGAKYDYADAPPDVLARVAMIQAVCVRHGVPMPAAALQFPLAHPAVAAVIPGAMNRTELLANLDWMMRPIPPALWEELRAEGLLDPRAPTP
jgi:D-threo-aldose 1-dehydrogenase